MYNHTIVALSGKTKGFPDNTGLNVDQNIPKGDYNYNTMRQILCGSALSNVLTVYHLLLRDISIRNFLNLDYVTTEFAGNFCVPAVITGGYLKQNMQGSPNIKANSLEVESMDITYSTNLITVVAGSSTLSLPAAKEGDTIKCSWDPRMGIQGDLVITGAKAVLTSPCMYNYDKVIEQLDADPASEHILIQEGFYSSYKQAHTKQDKIAIAGFALIKYFNTL